MLPFRAERQGYGFWQPLVNHVRKTPPLQKLAMVQPFCVSGGVSFAEWMDAVIGDDRLPFKDGCNALIEYGKVRPVFRRFSEWPSPLG